MTSFKTYDPFYGSFQKEYFYNSENELLSSLQFAQQGFLSWKNLTFTQRQEELKPLLVELASHKEVLARSITSSMGKPYLQALAEVDKSLQTLQYFLSNDFLPPQLSAQILIQPKGVILGLMPWNFPVWQLIRMMIPALLMGNSVLIKFSEVTAAVSFIFESFVKQCKLQHLIQFVFFSHDLTESLIAQPEIGGVSLTGSTEAGLKIASMCARYLKKSVLELGGSDAYIVCEDASLKLAAQKIALGRLQNTGQSCIAVKRVLVPEKKYEELMAVLIPEFQSYNFGDPFKTETTLGPLASVQHKKIEQSKFEQFSKYCEVVFEKEVSFSGFKELQNHTENVLQQAFFPLRILNFKNRSPEALHIFKSLEFFSPTLVLQTYKTLDEALLLANETQYALGGGVFGRDAQIIKFISEQMRCGLFAVNDFVKSSAYYPFGGALLSGWGKEFGDTGFLEFTEQKVILNRGL